MLRHWGFPLRIDGGDLSRAKRAPTRRYAALVYCRRGHHVGVIELRVLEPDEWQLWREVRRRALAEAPQAFGSTLESWSGNGDTEGRWRARLSEVPFNVVAVVEDIAVGQASGTAVGDDGQSEVISMWLAPQARGTGAAEALLGRSRSGLGARAHLRWCCRSIAPMTELSGSTTGPASAEPPKHLTIRAST